MNSFKEKLFKHAWDLAGKKAQFESEMSVYRSVGIECGEWAREETIKEVLALLRTCPETYFINSRNGKLEFDTTPIDASCWLELKMNTTESPNSSNQAQSVHQQVTNGAEDEPTVVMKDPMYRIPDDEL